MAARDVRKYFNLFANGRSYAGQAEDFTPPKLEALTESFRAGAMAGPIKLKMGLQEMDTEFSLISYDKNILSLFGIVQGANIQFLAREVLESYGNAELTGVSHVMRGSVISIDQGTAKAGEKVLLKITMNLSAYRLTHGSDVVHDIDIENMIGVVNGVDTLAQVRQLLGM